MASCPAGNTVWPFLMYLIESCRAEKDIERAESDKIMNVGFDSPTQR